MRLAWRPSPAGLAGRVTGYVDLPLTYPEVGATRGPLPAGYHRTTLTAELGPGADLAAAGEALLGWVVHRAAGLRVAGATPRARAGLTTVLAAPAGPVGVLVPVRVVWVLDEADRAGFGYGSLPGHPLRGEEGYLLRRTGSGRVVAEIRAFSRPAGPVLPRVAPVVHRGQRWLAERYLAALARAAGSTATPG